MKMIEKAPKVACEVGKVIYHRRLNSYMSGDHGYYYNSDSPQTPHGSGEQCTDEKAFKATF
jgi:hypothetical protein